MLITLANEVRAVLLRVPLRMNPYLSASYSPKSGSNDPTYGRGVQSSDLGGGVGHGGGSGGSIREAGGSFGKMEAAREEEYFRRLQKLQLQNLRKQVDDEVEHHEQQMRHHKEMIERHRKRQKEIAQEEEHISKR